MSDGLYAKIGISYFLSAIFNAIFGIIFLSVWLAVHFNLVPAPSDPNADLAIDSLVVFGATCLVKAVFDFFRSRRSPES